MRLVSLFAENYGVFHHRHLNFDGGLHVVYGPNEAGKSTLLQLIRESLFGFPHQSPYNWRHSAKMVSTVRMRLKDGRTAQFRRQKGRPDDISGAVEGTGERIADQNDVARLLGGANENLFTNLCGFSLSELATGQESLKNAGLGEILSSGGINGLKKFREVQSRISDERETLFTTRGRSKEFNLAMKDLADSRQRYLASRVSVREYEELQQRLRNQQDKLQATTDSIARLRARQSMLEQCAKAWPLRKQIDQLQTQIRQLALPASVSTSDIAQFQKWKSDLDRIETEVSKLSSSEQESSNLDDAIVDHQLLAHAQQVEELWRDVHQIRSTVETLQQLEEGNRERQTQLDRLLSQLGADWNAERLQEVSISLIEREQLKEWSRQDQELQQKIKVIDAQFPELSQKLSKLRTQLEEFPAHRSAEHLQELIDQGDEYRLNQAQRRDLLGRLESLQQNYQRQLREVNTPIGLQREHWNDVPVLLRATIREWQDDWKQAKEQLDAADQRVAQLDDDVRAANQAIADFDQLHPDLAAESLSEIRHQRDQLWQDIKSCLLSGEDVAGSRLKEFDSILRQVDEVSDKQTASSELVAHRKQLVQTRDRLEEQHQQAQSKRETAQQAFEKLREDWNSLWQPCDLTPLPPSSMLEWRDAFERLQLVSSEQSDVKQNLAGLDAAIERFGTELLRAYPDQTPQDENESNDAVDHALRAAQTEMREIGRLQDERNRLEKEIAELEPRVERLEAERFEYSLDVSDLDAKRRKLLGSLGVDQKLSSTITEGFVELVLDARRLQGELEQSERSRTQLVEQQAEFEERLKKLFAGLKRPLPVVDQAEEIEALHQELKTAQQRQVEQARSKDRLSRVESRLEELAEDRSQIEKQIQDRRVELSLTDTLSLDVLIETAQEQASLQQEVANLQRQLAALGEHDFAEWSQFEELEIEQQRIQMELEGLQEEYDRQRQEQGVLRHELTQLENRKSGQQAGELVHHRTRLADIVERWSALALGQSILTRARERFEKEHGSKILEHVVETFEHVTDGRYVDIRPDFENPTELRVIERDGTAKQVDQLSTGTREQLYLAIRLGYLAEYSEKQEPLPMVMDDVLVNFDEGRARRTLETLQKASDHIQILLFTCHQRTVELCRDVAAEARIVELLPGSLESETSSPFIPERHTSRRKDRQSSEQPALFPNS